MIEVTDISTCGWETAITGMRAPHRSYAKSDSVYKDGVYQLGPNDVDLAFRLCKAGTEHRKFLRFVHVQMRIKAPLFFYKELETYKVATSSNSESTMHSIEKKPFTLDDFSCGHLMNDKETSGSVLTCTDGSDSDIIVTPKSLLNIIIGCLNNYRKMYLETKDKEWWWQMIQLLPSSYNQVRFFDCSMETLLNICHQRKNHKLDEWRDFVNICFREVPYLEAFYDSAYGGK